MKIKDINGDVLYTSETAESMREAVEEAVRADVALLYADLYGAGLNRADLRGGDLRYADLRWTFLVKADLTDADLRYARLFGARLTHAILTDADFRDTEF